MMNTDTKHTPGPWEYAPGSKGFLGNEKSMKPLHRVFTKFKEITNGPQAEIAECKYGTQAAQMGNSDFQHTISEKEAEANAALIAAAPDMYEALKDLLELSYDLDIRSKYDPSPIQTKAKAALSKASP